MNLPPRSRIRLRELVDEAVAGITQRAGRSLLTMLGTVIGIAVLVVVLGLTQSASVQVSREFSLVEATEVRVRHESVTGTGSRIASMAFPIDAERRATAIDGVNSATLRWPLTAQATNPPNTRPGAAMAASPGAFVTADATFSQGRGYDSGHEDRAARVAVIGTVAARDLGIGDLSRQPAIDIGGIRFSVIGIVDDTSRLPDLITGVTIPTSTARALWRDPPPDSEIELVLDVDPGAAPVAGPQLPVALSATDPGRYSVSLPPDPTGLRQTVDAQLSGLFLVLAAVCLVVGMIGIANTTIVAVMERTGEIGLRRAMGARPRHIAAQFLTETAILGGLGGITGTGLGVIAVVGICATLTWTAVVSPILVVTGPAIGLTAGTLAGVYPALRASRLEPVDALRS